MWFFTIIFWALFIAGAFMILLAMLEKKGGSDIPDHPHMGSTLEILKKRFASGEIDEDTFKRMKSELEG